MKVSTTPARVERALTEALPRVHRGRVGICRCGACSHQLRLAELRHGLQEGSLRGRLSKYDPPAPAEREGRAPRRLTAQVGAAATVVSAGRTLSLSEAIALLGGRGGARGIADPSHSLVLS